MRKAIALILSSLFLFSVINLNVFANNGIYNEAENKDIGFEPDAKSVVLMEAKTGEIIYSKNGSDALSPASVTKIMTLILICESIAENKITLSDTVTISEHAASMGGSQVFLSAGEEMCVEDLLKCVIIASANDAAVALAEFVAGNEDAFVSKMNSKAKDLNLKSTNLENTTGLDDETTNHLTSAIDIALMSQELLKYDIVTKYSSMWQSSIRNGEFILTNTNRLVRFYDGCNGLKTGSTEKAGYCISATAKRNGMQLIAVVMGAETRDKRNDLAKKLLDFGFAEYQLFEKSERYVSDVNIIGSKVETCALYAGSFSVLVKKDDVGRIEERYDIPKKIIAPQAKGVGVGKVFYVLDGKNIAECELYFNDNIEKLTYLKTLGLFITYLFKK